ncbi:Isoquinoline 1-oxidoreductase subunit [Neorhizobium sp. T25_27]|uniref:Isoquinoline 1-oxidoreductase subunit n=1 Tax=Neorhizobium sp. T25_27 TaxID=2093831 RepID=UPI000CF8E80A|nr:Isoquinoline 1-oxidoreductase subunit [Neorhizobium sp. T25_27]
MNWKLAITGVATLCLFVGAGTLLSPTSVAQDAKTDAKTLKPAASFETIANQRERSVALFQEAGKVIQHPRCVNCHPATERPLQGANMHPHQPPVVRGDGGMGLPGMQCTTCHSAENTPVVGQADTIKSIPGNPAWHLAPIEMAWVGKSLGQICQQIKDPGRNGGKTMDQIVEHMAHDELVGWGWNPGAGREPVPGTQAEFGELISAWVKSGAACPAS